MPQTPDKSCVCEPLEQRRLLFAGLYGDELQIAGTAKDDHIFVALGGNGTSLDVKVNNVVSTYELAHIREIKIWGLAGNDHIEIVDANGVVPRQTRIFGGGGADTIVGGAAIDRIHGDDGNDLVTAAGNKDRVWGDSGDDSVFGGKGDDLVDGGLHNDYCEGNRGNDSVFGGDGDDDCLGLDGNDSIDGGNGDDDCRGGNGLDSNHGGAGNDDFFDDDNDGGLHDVFDDHGAGDADDNHHGRGDDDDPDHDLNDDHGGDH